jgi:hypothetical protein
VDPSNPAWPIEIAALCLQTKDPVAQSDIESSADVAVLGLTGQMLFGIGSAINGSPEAAVRGERLLRKAQAMDPRNKRWEQTLTVLPALLAKARARSKGPSLDIALVSAWITSTLREEDLWPGGKVPSLLLPPGGMAVEPAGCPRNLQPYSAATCPCAESIPYASNCSSARMV